MARALMRDHRIPETLPVVDAFVRERLPAGFRFRLSAAVLIQHQLGCIVPMTRALLSLGVDPLRLYWVDIPYTANAQVAAALADLGIPERNFAPRTYTLETPYAPYQLRRVTHLIAELRRELGPADRILVLDDGGYFAEAAACFAGKLPQVALVEQTRRGMKKIRGDASSHEYARRVRFVNVAEAWPKLDVEPTLIAPTIIRALLDALATRREVVAKGPTLLLGYGAMGSAIARALIDDAVVPRGTLRVYDPDPAAREAAERDGLATWTRDEAEPTRFRLVVGCSGTASFAVGDRVFLADGAVLASASSGSAELSREQFIELADSHAEDDVYVYERETLADRDLHSTIRLRLVDRDVEFLNGGFPVNFDGLVNSTPVEKIQLTHSLMLAGAVQAVEAASPGIDVLDDTTGDWLVARFRELVSGSAPRAPRG